MGPTHIRHRSHLRNFNISLKLRFRFSVSPQPQIPNTSPQSFRRCCCCCCLQIIFSSYPEAGDGESEELVLFAEEDLLWQICQEAKGVVNFISISFVQNFIFIYLLLSDHQTGRRLCQCWGPTRTKSSISVDNGEIHEHESFTAQLGSKDEHDSHAAQIDALAPPGSETMEEMAAIRIQTAFRWHLARRVLKGRARLKSFVGGQYTERELASAARCLQRMTHLQFEVRAVDNSYHRLHRFMETWRNCAINAVNRTFMDPFNPCWEWRWSKKWILENGGALEKGLERDPVPTTMHNLVPTKNDINDYPCRPKPGHRILSNSIKSPRWSTTLKGSVNGVNEEHTSVYITKSSDGCHRRRLSARDDTSLTSCPASVPSRHYMASTASSRAKARLRSPLSEVGGARRRLTFPVDG